MLLDEDAGCQGIDGVVLFHRNCALKDDRTSIELAGDEVNRDAADLHTIGERLRLRVDAGKRRQQ